YTGRGQAARPVLRPSALARGARVETADQDGIGEHRDAYPSRLLDLGTEDDAAPEHTPGADRTGSRLEVAEAVLQREQHAVRGEERSDGGRDGGRVVRLHGEQDGRV